MVEDDDEAEAGDREARAVHRLLRSFRSSHSYGLVLLMLVVTYVLAVALSEPLDATILLFVQIATVWLALRTAGARRGLLVVANVVFVVAVAGAVANVFTDDDSALRGFVFVAASLLYIVAPLAIVRNIAYRRAVDQETMLGALAAYLCIGMAFAFAYRSIGAIDSGPFFGAGGDGTLSDDLFFSFVTLTTTGYGNLVPAGNPGQSLAVLEALVGQLFLITAVGKIVTAWRPRAWRDPADGTGPESAT